MVTFTPAATGSRAAMPHLASNDAAKNPFSINNDRIGLSVTMSLTATQINGLAADGDWTLFVADVAAGETMTLKTWSMTIIGVPEPAPAAMLGLAAGLLAWRRRRG